MPTETHNQFLSNKNVSKAVVQDEVWSFTWLAQTFMDMFEHGEAAWRHWQRHKPLTRSVYSTELSKQRESYLLYNTMENVTRLHRQGVA